MKSDITVNIKECHGLFFLYNYEIGAVSLFNSNELFAFQIFMNNKIKLLPFIIDLGYSNEEACKKELEFKFRLERDGWLRNEIPTNKDNFLESVYFTITRECNLSCPYCFQGLNNRSGTNMSISDIAYCLDAIRSINKDSHIILTGGEPFKHPKIFEIFDLLSENNMSFCIITNGTLIDKYVAKSLNRYTNLSFVQISIDGINQDTHSLTRGNSFIQTINGINNIIEEKIPFILSPTVHNDNIHELFEIANFAISNGGFVSPNNLKNLPHDNNDRFFLNENKLYVEIRRIEKELLKKFDYKYLMKVKSLLKSHCIRDLKRNRSYVICGLGRSVIDIDWNGDIFPCNLLKAKEFKLGNIFDDSLKNILSFNNTERVRTFSFKILKCATCMFVATCGGGCRAATYYERQRLDKEDSLCKIIYKTQIDNLLQEYVPIL